MERDSSKATLVPSFLREGWDVVKLGRLAGAFVLASALTLAAWEVAMFPGDELSIKIYAFWRTLVQVGSFGVIIILLAELAGRLQWSEAEDDSTRSIS